MDDKPRRLLIIEDNDADVFLIKRALRENDISAEVTVCTDGEAAVRLLNSPEMKAPPDAIIIDLALPRIEGLDVLRKILHRPALVGTPIMVFTSSPSPADKHRVELLTGARYVQKPSGVDKFLREVAINVKAMFGESSQKADRSKPE
jgi:CheY-like chemotaxis protein